MSYACDLLQKVTLCTTSFMIRKPGTKSKPKFQWRSLYIAVKSLKYPSKTLRKPARLIRGVGAAHPCHPGQTQKIVGVFQKPSCPIRSGCSSPWITGIWSSNIQDSIMYATQVASSSTQQIHRNSRADGEYTSSNYSKIKTECITLYE